MADIHVFVPDFQLRAATCGSRGIHRLWRPRPPQGRTIRRRGIRRLRTNTYLSGMYSSPIFER